MKLLVTGGSGFTGRRLVAQAVDRGDEVVALARSKGAAQVVESIGAQALPGDLDDPASVAAAFASAAADALLNIASLGFGHAPTVVRVAEGAGLRRAVFVSTTAVTTSLPAPSKAVRLAAEKTVMRSTLDWTIIRPTMIYGDAGDRNLSRLLQLLRRTPILPVPGGGHGLQQPVHVDDLAQLLLAAVAAPKAVGRTYDVAGPEPLSFRELVSEAGQAVGRRPVVVGIPLGPAVAVLSLYEAVVRHPRLKAEQLERLVEDKAFSILDASLDFNYEPRSFQDGIRAEAAAMRR